MDVNINEIDYDIEGIDNNIVVDLYGHVKYLFSILPDVANGKNEKTCQDAVNAEVAIMIALEEVKQMKNEDAFHVLEDEVDTLYDLILSW